ncbi:MAG: hypothetical protein V7646_5135, partial [Pseudonocardia sp.]
RPAVVPTVLAKARTRMLPAERVTFDQIVTRDGKHC